jgi:putative FmdB family regulatory protein
MPIYEYQCLGCAHEFETIQKFSDPPLTHCPACGKELLKKKISAVAFRLKGGGWYETDFKAGDKRNVARGDEGGESKSADADSKPAAADGSAVTPKAEAGGGTASAAGKDKASKDASGSVKSAEKAPKPNAAKPAKGDSKAD